MPQVLGGISIQLTLIVSDSSKILCLMLEDVSRVIRCKGSKSQYTKVFR